MLKNTLTVALRNIKKHKGFSFILVTGLAVGMACCLLMALFIQDELSYDTYHKNANRIYRIIKQTTSKGTTSLSTATPPPLASALIQDFPEVENVVRFMETPYKEVLLGCQDKQFYENRFFFADAAVFEVFSFPLVKGDPTHALREPYTLVLTQKMARKYFGSQNPRTTRERVDQRNRRQKERTDRGS